MTQHSTDGETRLSRRTFARSLAFAGATAWIVQPETGLAKSKPFPSTPSNPGEGFWETVREQFYLPPGLGVMNAANLCPALVPVVETQERLTRDLDRDPSFPNRVKLGEGREATRKLLAEFMGVTAEEIILTRNTSEGNNLVSSGIDLKADDEVILFSDNHPSNLDAWKVKSRRFGFTVRIIEQVNPHPGDAYYLEAVAKQLTERTRVLGFTHLSSTVGDLLPARELCRMAREKGVLTLVDGAQSLGLIEVNLAEMQPDFYTSSAHKWPCGPKEVGVLYINKAAQSRIWPSIVSAFPGATGISKTFESFGQRDEPAIMGFGEALKFQTKIGRKVIEARSRELAQALIQGLQKIPGVQLWTSTDPKRSHSVVSFRPGNLDIPKLAAALYEKDRLAGAPRLGADRGGLRFSPHYYNLHSEVDRALAAVKRYVERGV